MIRRHIIRPHAREDLENQLGYLEGIGGAELAHSFSRAVQEAVAVLSRHPDAGSPRLLRGLMGAKRLKGLRAWPVPGFEDIRIYYLISNRNTLKIVRILHGKRDVDRILALSGN